MIKKTTNKSVVVALLLAVMLFVQPVISLSAVYPPARLDPLSAVQPLQDIPIQSTNVPMFYSDIAPTSQNTRDFPSLIIHTEGTPFVERTLWLNATISVENGTEVENFPTVNGSIRGRGNSTWFFPSAENKRPLRLRFNEPRVLMSANYPARDWILLADNFDRSLLRNFSALSLANSLEGMSFAPRPRHVHLYVNDEYMGVYLLTDERDIGPERMQLVANRDPAICEYMLEMCVRLPSGDGIEGVDYVIVNGMPYELRFPGGSVRSTAHGDYVQDFLYNVSEAIRSRDFEEVLKHIDLDSFIDFYIVKELYMKLEAFATSMFMSIQGQGDNRRLHMGPVWDFDSAAGNSRAHTPHLHFYSPITPEEASLKRAAEHGYSPIGIWVASRNYWFRNLMMMPEFFEAVTNRWNEIKDNQIADTIATIQHMRTQYATAFERNFERHPIHTTYSPISPNRVWNLTTHAQQVDFLVEFLTLRAAWLDDFFNNPPSYTLGTEINFAGNHDSLDFFFVGLAPPEAWGTWSMGDHTHFTVWLDEPITRDLILNVNARVFGGRANSQRVLLYAGGNLVEERRLQPTWNGTDISFRIPRRAVTEDERLVLRFEFPDATSPHELNNSNGDRRELALGFINMTISTAMTD